MIKNGILLISILCLLSGCVAPDRAIEGSTNDEQPIERLTFQSLTYTWDESSSVSDLNAISGNQSTLLLWVGASCRGCHDWTDMLREGIENGSLEGISIVSIHRYSAFEQTDDVLARYVGNDSEYPIKWSMMLPSEDVDVINLDSGLISDSDLYDAFLNPSTPTLQIYHADGSIVPIDHSYWASWQELQDISTDMGLLNSGGR